MSISNFDFYMMHLFKISEQRKQSSLFETVNLFLLLSLSGINFFSDNETILIAVFGLNLFVFLFKNKKIDNGFLGFTLFFIFLSIAQLIWLSNGSLKSSLGFFLRLLTAYLVLRNTADFIQTYLRLLFFLSIAAIFFYVFFLIFPAIEEQLFVNKHFWDSPSTNDVKKSLIIYNIFREPLDGVDSLGLFGLPRNSGPFWEPGAFAGYLTVGIAFEMILVRKVTTRVIIFIVALLSTFSTMGYLSAAIFFLLYFLFLETNKTLKWLIFPVLSAGIVYLIFEVDFLANKIAAQVKSFEEGQIYLGQSDDDTRIGSTVLDLRDFQRSPVLGTGPSDETRYGKSEILFMRTNGVTDMLVRFGIIGFIFIFYFFGVSVRRYFSDMEISKPKTSANVLIFVIILIALSETYFNMPFFWSLFLLRYAETDPDESYEMVDG